MAVGSEYRGSDFYCDVAIPHIDQLDVVHDDARVLVYHHTKPFWPVHVVVVPKRHIESLLTATGEDAVDIAAVLSVVQRIATDVERDHGAARVLTNVGRYQDSKHLHVHVAAGRPREIDPD